MVGNDTKALFPLTAAQEVVSRSTNTVGLVIYAVYLLLVVLAVFAPGDLAGIRLWKRVFDYQFYSAGYSLVYAFSVLGYWVAVSVA